MFKATAGAWYRCRNLSRLVWHRPFDMADRSGKTRVSETLKSDSKSFEVARKNLSEILRDIEGMGTIARAFYLWSTYSRLMPRKKWPSRKFGIIVILFATFIYGYGKKTVIVQPYDKCIFNVPSSFRQMFRPAEDCSMCSNVEGVEKISDVSPMEFENRYAYTGRPVVVTDATTNWSALEEFSFSFFKNLYEGRDASCQFFPYKTEFKSLRDVFNMSQTRATATSSTEPWYVGWSNCNEEVGTILRKHYHRPYFLPETAESEKTDWIFMGSSGYGAHMHVDDVEHPSWQAQLKGAKLWILEPPRECHYSCHRMTITVDPGEIIVLDTNRWYHQTRIVSKEMSITIGAEFD